MGQRAISNCMSPRVICPSTPSSCQHVLTGRRVERQRSGGGIGADQGKARAREVDAAVEAQPHGQTGGMQHRAGGGSGGDDDGVRAGRRWREHRARQEQDDGEPAGGEYLHGRSLLRTARPGARRNRRRRDAREMEANNPTFSSMDASPP
jgi:hypothetical protein